MQTNWNIVTPLAIIYSNFTSRALSYNVATSWSSNKFKLATVSLLNFSSWSAEALKFILRYDIIYFIFHPLAMILTQIDQQLRELFLWRLSTQAPCIAWHRHLFQTHTHSHAPISNLLVLRTRRPRVSNCEACELPEGDGKISGPSWIVGVVDWSGAGEFSQMVEHV